MAEDSDVEAALKRARAAYPDIQVDADGFAAHLRSRAGNEESPDSPDLESLHIEDLYLAWAAGCGDRAALTAFEREMAGPIRIALSKIDASEELKRDAVQQVRTRLLTTDGDRNPRLWDYAGRGPLRRWLQAAIVRECLSSLRRTKREVALDTERAERELPAPHSDPELEHLRRVYGSAFQEAFAAAIANLDDRERTLLRYHMVDGATIDEIGALYDVHRTTAFRWIERARDHLVELTREHMMSSLSVGATEVESILRVIRSQVHISVQRHFGQK